MLFLIYENSKLEDYIMIEIHNVNINIRNFAMNSRVVKSSPTVITTGSVQYCEAKCSTVVRMFNHGVMGNRIKPIWWTH